MAGLRGDHILTPGLIVYIGFILMMYDQVAILRYLYAWETEYNQLCCLMKGYHTPRAFELLSTRPANSLPHYLITTHCPINVKTD